MKVGNNNYEQHLPVAGGPEEDMMFDGHSTHLPNTNSAGDDEENGKLSSEQLKTKLRYQGLMLHFFS